MNSFGDVMRNLDWSVVTDMLMSVIPALVCITLHEISHGYVAYKLGDNTAKIWEGSRSIPLSISTLSVS